MKRLLALTRLVAAPARARPESPGREVYASALRPDFLGEGP
jgi:hypothetical protein